MSDTENTPGAEEKQEKQDTFVDIVSKIADSAKYDDDGSMILPDKTTTEVAHAVKLFVQSKKSQSGLMKSEQSVASLTAQNKVLENKVQELLAKGAFSKLDQDSKTRLTELKSSDPEAWRDEMDKLETKMVTATDDDLKKELTAAGSKAIIAARAKLLNLYNAANPTKQITQEVIDKDIPPRIKDKLANNTIDFSTFLSEVSTYMSRGKKISKEKVTKTDEFRGTGESYEKNGVKESIDYEKQIF